MHGIALLSLVLIFGVFPDQGYANGPEDIHAAATNGDIKRVLSVIDVNPELLNAQDEAGMTPLNKAIKSNDDKLAEFLIMRGANVNTPDTANLSPLHYAAIGGDPNIVRLLLEHGSTTISETMHIQKNELVGGWTPLHLACLEGHPEVTKLLLEHGADIEARDGVQRTPLILAAEGENLRVAEILIEHNANINAQAIRDFTPLLWAARNQRVAIVNLLISKGASISDEARPRAFQMAVISGMEDLYKYLLEIGFNMDETRQRDPGLIFPAATGGSAAIVKSLVDFGFDPMQQDSDGWTPIHYAAAEGRVDVLVYFAEKGLDINVRNKRGETAFNLASQKGHNEAADYFKKIGADTSAPLFPILEGPYMGQEPPGDMPRIFLPGIVSAHDRAHSSITFSPDALEAYWTEMIPPEGRVAYMRAVEDKWTYPVTAAIDRDPTFSPDGKRLYFIQTRPFKEGEVAGGDPDLKEEYWYMEKTDSGWTEPISVGDEINKIGVHWPCSVDKAGNLYFSEFSDNMHCSKYIDGKYGTPVLLTEYCSNPTLVGHNPFISPDGDYLLFLSDDSLNISFKKNDGTWTDKINLGGEINASHVNGSPRITADGKYMFFVSAGQDRPWGIYWVSADFIGRLKSIHLSGN